MFSLFNLFLAMLVSVIIVFLSIPVLVKIAKKHGIVDEPNPRKLNKVPVPVLGGVGVFLGIMLATSLFLAEGIDKELFCLFSGMLFMLYIGVCDDITDMKAVRKLGYQFLAVALLVFAGEIRLHSFQGLFGIWSIPFSLSVFLSLFYGVGILNAINLIDGVDGLASGYSMLVCVVLGICFVYLGDYELSLLCFSTFGALFPFLLANVFGRRNKMYIGDAGSLILGMLFTTFITLFMNHPDIQLLPFSPVVFLLALFAIPVFDTLRVMGCRMLRGNSPFTSDKTHLHHVLLGFGFSHARVTVMELLITLVLLALAFFINGLSQEYQLMIIIIAGIIFIFSPTILFHWYEQHCPERITRRRLEAESRKKTSFLYRTMQRLADGKINADN